MDSWQQSTLRADTEYRLRFYGNAILLHNQALDWARCAFEATVTRNPDLAISRIIISHFHLAECYLALDEIARAGDFYLQAQSFLLDLLREQRHPALLEAAQHALGHVDGQWLGYLKKHREALPYQRLLQYHEGARAGAQWEAAHAVRH